MILLLDHRDSFTYNIAQALQSLGAEVEVREASKTTLATVRRLRPRRLLLGPGPGKPEQARLAREVIEAFSRDVPTLGVCLGHQVIGLAFGACVTRARAPVHGRAVRVSHDGRGAFHDLPSPLACARYNSLSVVEESLPPCLEVSARAEDGDLMGLRHREWPVEGVQFHPESVLSERGMELLENFVRS